MVKVELLDYTKDSEKLIASAARLCYSPRGVTELMNNMTENKVNNLVNDLLIMGHESPFEHTKVTFGIEGISRACSHQLVRHRIASYSQQSQRYVNMGCPDYVVPDSVRMDAQALGYYFHILGEVTKYYNALVVLGIPEEDARYVLPNATETKIIVTMNFRALFNFFRLRCCNRAQWEIRMVADEMLKQCKKIAPNVFKLVGPPCVVDGKCNQGKMSCGKKREADEWVI